MNSKLVVVVAVIVVVVLAVGAYFAFSQSPAVQIVNSTSTTTISSPLTLSPACASTGNCTVQACPVDSSFNASTNGCYWNYTGVATQPSQSSSCEGGVCVNTPIVFQNGAVKNVSVKISNSAAQGSAYLNVTCGTSIFTTPNFTVASGGSTANATLILNNLGGSPIDLGCTAVVYTHSGALTPGVHFATIVNPSCPGGALARNSTTCKAVIPSGGGNPCGDGFVYSQANGLCEPEPLYCSGAYNLDPQIPGVCVISNACPSGYSFELSGSSKTPLCSKA